jgi:hypothetical protein
MDGAPLPEAQGQAALLLVESLIHCLIDNGALTRAQAMEAIEDAAEVKVDNAGEGKEPGETLRKSIALLRQIQISIEGSAGRG